MHPGDYDDKIDVLADDLFVWFMLGGSVIGLLGVVAYAVYVAYVVIAGSV